MIRLVRGAALGAFMLLLVSTIPVLAHSELVESDPADGATIETPYTLTATFSEEFDPDRSFIRVQGGGITGGVIVATGVQSPDDPTVMTVDLPALHPGVYLVHWQTTTIDDNGVERGTFTFNVAAAATPAPTATPSPTPTAGATPAPPASAPPTASPVPTTPSPAATPVVSDGQPTAGGNDVVLALVLAAVALLVIGVFLFTRSRR